MIDVQRVSAFKLPALAKHLTGMFGNHQHRGHAQGMRHHKITRQVFEHRCLLGIDTVRLEKPVIGLRRRLGLELGRDDVEHAIEVTVELEPRQNGIGVSPRAVGQDQLAPWQVFDRRP